MALNQDGERQLGGLAAVGRKALEELAVGQVADDPDVEQRFELVHHGRAFGCIPLVGILRGGWSAIADPTREAAGESIGADRCNVPRGARSSEILENQGAHGGGKAFDHARENAVRTGRTSSSLGR